MQIITSGRNAFVLRSMHFTFTQKESKAKNKQIKRALALEMSRHFRRFRRAVKTSQAEKHALRVAVNNWTYRKLASAWAVWTLFVRRARQLRVSELPIFKSRTEQGIRRILTVWKEHLRWRIHRISITASAIEFWCHKMTLRSFLRLKSHASDASRVSGAPS